MSSKTKTFNCKYCDISGIPRNEYKKHIRTTQHRNMLEYSRHSDKVRTQMKVNEKSSSTQVKFTKDGKYVNDFVKSMKEEKKYNCQYCQIFNMSRSDYSKHIKLSLHFVNMNNEKKREKICQSINVVNNSGKRLRVLKSQQISIDNTKTLINKQYGTDFSFNEIVSGKGFVKDETTGEMKPVVVRCGSNNKKKKRY
jgi:hypothetical protein